MASLMASFRNEWAKLIARKKYLVFIIIGLLICLLWSGLSQIISGFARTQGGFNINLTPTPMTALPLFLQILIPFLIFMGVTDLITVEGADNNLKAMLCRPVERWKLYASKLMAVLTYAALYLACVFVMTAVLNQVFGKQLSANELFMALVSYALTLIPLAILSAYAALVALMGRSGTLTMFLLLLSYMLLNALPFFFPVLSEILFTSYLRWYRLWIGALPNPGKMLHMLLIVTGYATTFFTAGSLLFDRKEY
ncbi:MAG: ABC transporter permease [Oscillospiraceae bacterium]|nr:ABC transporter permease [Oscillospiraceae bacterium]